MPESQSCEDSVAISHLAANFSTAREIPTNRYIYPGELNDHAPRANCDTGYSHHSRHDNAHKLSHLMNLIAEANGHKDGIQKNDVRDILSYVTYKRLPKRMFVIRAILTCFALLRSDACNIFAQECKMTRQLSTTDGQYSCRLFNALFIWHFNRISDNADTDMMTTSSATCFVLPSFGDLDTIDMSGLNLSGEVIILGNSDDRPLCFNSNFSRKDINLSGSVPPGYPTYHNFFEQDKSINLEKMFLYFSKEFPHHLFPTEFLFLQKDAYKNVEYTTIEFTQGKTIIDVPLNTKVLNKSHNRIDHFGMNASASWEFLLHIDISDNLITEFHVNMSSMINLKYLDLSNNKLSALSSTTISQLNEIAAASEEHTLTIDIGGNNLLCTCDTNDFVKWVLRSHPTNIHFVNVDDYKCTDSYSEHIPLQEISVFTSFDYLICTLRYYKLCLMVSVAAIIFRFVYKRRYWLCHLLYRIFKWFHYTDDNQQQHTHDAFICFDKADRDWIDFEMKEHLKHLKMLKIRYGEQDVGFGQNIHNAIFQYIRESRRSILVLSPAFVHSPSNVYYADMIREKLIDTGDDSVIVVELKPLNREGLANTALAELMKPHSCLKWNENNQQEQDIFWERLVIALQTPCIKSLYIDVIKVVLSCVLSIVVLFKLYVM